MVCIHAAQSAYTSSNRNRSRLLIKASKHVHKCLQLRIDTKEVVCSPVILVMTDITLQVLNMCSVHFRIGEGRSLL